MFNSANFALARLLGECKTFILVIYIGLHKIIIKLYNNCSSHLIFFPSACPLRGSVESLLLIVWSLSPVRLNWRVHMHFPEAVHLGQSDASQLVSVQLLDRKISLWFILQSCSDVQLTKLLIHAPSGQFVHHLHCRAG